jgi:hypothetical protein
MFARKVRATHGRRFSDQARPSFRLDILYYALIGGFLIGVWYARRSS